jgi:zinc transporter 1/2/3
MAPSFTETTALLSQFDKRDGCSAGGGAHTYTSLRIASVFVILATSTFGALFPVLSRRTSWLRVPTPVFKYVIETYL